MLKLLTISITGHKTKIKSLWGLPRIYGKLLKEGMKVIERTTSNIIKKDKSPKPPSQTWLVFLKNHMHNTFAIDFFKVAT